MHQNVYRRNYSDVLCMKFQYEKFNFFGQNRPIFFLSAQNASKCMQNELCKWFVHEIIKEVVFITFEYDKIYDLQFYMLHFLVNDPVVDKKLNFYF